MADKTISTNETKIGISEEKEMPDETESMTGGHVHLKRKREPLVRDQGAKDSKEQRNHLKAKKNVYFNMPVRSRYSVKKRHHCPHCEYRTVSKVSLQKHITSCHSVETLLYCPHCNYKTLALHHFNGHIRAFHTVSKVFFCYHCDFNTIYLFELESHIITCHIHDGE